MTETKGHGSQILRVETLEQAGELLSNSTVEVEGGRVGHDLDTELLGDSTSELGVSDDEGLLNTLSLLGSSDLVDEELGEDLGELSLLELGEILNSVGGGGESVDSLELEAEEVKRSMRRRRSQYIHRRKGVELELKKGGKEERGSRPARSLFSSFLLSSQPAPQLPFLTPVATSLPSPSTQATPAAVKLKKEA